MELAFVRQDIEVRIVAKFVLTTLMVKIVHKNVSVKMVPRVHPKMAGATVQQDGLVFHVIVHAMINLSARTAKANANALIMLPAIHKMAHAHVQLVLLVNFVKIIVKKDFSGWDVHKPVIVMKRIV